MAMQWACGKPELCQTEGTGEEYVWYLEVNIIWLWQQKLALLFLSVAEAAGQQLHMDWQVERLLFSSDA